MELNREGFITNYLIAGPKVISFQSDVKQKDKNQLRYENMLREEIGQHEMNYIQNKIHLKEKSELGMPWEYYYSYGNWFVDRSAFYSSLKKVELVAAVCLLVNEDINVTANLFSYGAISCWLNDKRIAQIEKPVYKPIAQVKMKLALTKGENLIYIKMNNLGVRDTRNIFGIQILEKKEEITVTFPGADEVKPYVEAEKWLAGVCLKGHELIFLDKARPNTQIGYDSKSVDVTKQNERITWIDVSGIENVMIDKNHPYIILRVKVDQTFLTRRFELLEDIRPVYLNQSSIEEKMPCAFGVKIIH